MTGVKYLFLTFLLIEKVIKMLFILFIARKNVFEPLRCFLFLYIRVEIREGLKTN